MPTADLGRGITLRAAAEGVQSGRMMDAPARRRAGVTNLLSRVVPAPESRPRRRIVTSHPRRGARARRLLRPAAFLLAALALAGGPLASGRAAEDKDLPADLALVPPDGGLFLTLRAGDLAGGKVGKE